MTYSPTTANRAILDRASFWVRSVPYTVTARWVFYRLLQEGVYSQKVGYKHLLALLSKARKNFFDGWQPNTLADDTRAALVRGHGFDSPSDWVSALQQQITCHLDQWADQPVYIECWFEAAAMQAQFEHYTHPAIPLLAFHGDVSIPEKWKAAQRLAQRFAQLRKPITIYYFGDLDTKGLTIPLSAWTDIHPWTLLITRSKDLRLYGMPKDDLTLHRVGLNPGHETTFGITENPERPGTYQWEALADDQAQQLIEQVNDALDMDAFDTVANAEQQATDAARHHLTTLKL